MKNLALPLLLVLVFSLVGCDDNEPTDLTGHWTTADDASSPEMFASIADGAIVIQWHDDISGDTALYWKGTFVTEAEDEDNIVSVGDVEAMSHALLASGEESKTFTYEEGEITFDLTMMGITQLIVLQKAG